MGNRSHQQPGRGGGRDDPSVTLGIGEEQGGQPSTGSAPESQRETGGSGGSALTGNQVEEGGQRGGDTSVAADADICDLPAEALSDGGAVVTRGPEDTRDEQAGWTRTGLGAPDTGANQSAEDLQRRRKPKKD
jgi:hypothetical protein